MFSSIGSICGSQESATFDALWSGEEETGDLVTDRTLRVLESHLEEMTGRRIERAPNLPRVWASEVVEMRQGSETTKVGGRFGTG